MTGSLTLEAGLSCFKVYLCRDGQHRHVNVVEHCLVQNGEDQRVEIFWGL